MVLGTQYSVWLFLNYENGFFFLFHWRADHYTIRFDIKDYLFIIIQ